jgi:hypothetical protein
LPNATKTTSPSYSPAACEPGIGPLP